MFSAGLAATAVQGGSGGGTLALVGAVIGIVVVVLLVMWIASKFSLGEILAFDAGCCLIESIGCGIPLLAVVVTMGATIVAALQTLL